MTQEQLGDTTGLTSVHVNRTLKLLETDGLIDRLSPRSITIGDWKKLAEVGDFDSAYLHLTKASRRWPERKPGIARARPPSLARRGIRAPVAEW